MQRERANVIPLCGGGPERLDDVPLPDAPTVALDAIDDSMAANPEDDLPPPASPPTEYALTDLGNAERFARLCGSRYRYVKAWRAWLVWDGLRWKRDEVGSEMQAAKIVVRSLYSDAAAAARAAAGGDERAQDRAAAILKWARNSASEHAMRAMVALAQTEEPIVATPDTFDLDPMLLNVLDGTVDLRTGHVRAHRQGDMITQLAPVRFDAAATCPTFDAFFQRVQTDPAVRSWLQRFFGYCLSGDVGAQILVFFLGMGANGKSTLLNAVQSLLGDYATQGSPGLLIAAERGGDDQGKRHRATLRGRRFVACQEIEAGRYLNEAQVKQITGGDRLTCARLYENETEFLPTHKLVVAANTKPHVRGQDHGIWRRIRLVRFPVTIPSAERDPDLTAKLNAESAGILQWALRGCLAWQRDGLEPPASITIATDAYQADEDRLGEFLDARTVRDASAVIATAELHRVYIAWCDARGERPWSQRALTTAIEERGFETARPRIAGVQARAVVGLRARNPGES